MLREEWTLKLSGMNSTSDLPWEEYARCGAVVAEVFVGEIGRTVGKCSGGVDLAKVLMLALVLVLVLKVKSYIRLVMGNAVG